MCHSVNRFKEALPVAETFDCGQIVSGYDTLNEW